MEVHEGDVVLPGDIAVDIPKCASTTKVVLGPGLYNENNTVLINKCGILRKKSPNTYWVDCQQKRYIPSRGETVLGTVVNKGGDVFKVDIGASEHASLSYLAFEGATKKNRPDVNIGDVIFAKLLIASRDLEPELVCVDSHGKKGKLGVVSDGFVFNCSLNLVRKILNPKCPLLKALAKEYPYEIAAGMNGKIWIKARSTRETIAIANAILAAEFVVEEEIVKMCENVALSAAGF